MHRQLGDLRYTSGILGRSADKRVCISVKRTAKDGRSSKCNHRCEAASAVQYAPETPETEFKIAAEEMPAPRGGTLKEEATAYVEEHRIRAYEADPNQRTTIVTMSNLLQEVAGNHAVTLWGRTEAGFASDPIMVERSLIFAATRIQIQMDVYPKWGDLVSIETWFQPEGRMCACRNWIVRDATTMQEIGRGTSTWIMLNLKTRKLAKYPDEMKEKMNFLAPKPPRDALPPSEARQKIPQVELPPEYKGAVQVARRSDMDMNGHINNVTYVAWALETVPIEIYLNYTLIQAETDFKAECMAGDTIESLASRVVEDTNGTGVFRFIHTLRRCDENGCVELVRARTSWKPDPSKMRKNSKPTEPPPALQ